MRRPSITAAAGLAAGLSLLSAGPASAHGLSGIYESPLPLAVYLAGAAAAVALSFAIAFASGRRWEPQPAEPTRQVPRAVIVLLKLIGLFAWGWIIVQLIVGGSSDAAVDTLFTWVYGWVGLAIISALLGPLWTWLDPFTTLHDMGAWVLRRAGLGGGRVSTYPPALAAWPAVAGFVFFVWLELAYLVADMGLVVALYTVVTLAGMAFFGRDRWRQQGEVFSVWFGLLGRLARYAPAGPPESGAVRRQHFPDGLLGRPWDASLVALAAIGTGAILYDGLSQTELFFDVFGLTDIGMSTLLLLGFLGLLVGLALGVARRVGLAAMGAGLLPIAVGYLIAHYLTYLLADGQRILIAISDPFQLGWNLFGTAFHEPSIDWLAPSLAWSIMFVAVVGGHVLAAWAGHRGAESTAGGSADRAVQLPLALVMVGLTSLTLWSLGQAVIPESV